MDYKNNKAIYLQIVDHVFEQILLDKWKVDSKLPSVRELAVNMEVNPNTVMRAYAYLEQQDIISMHRGIGFFITKNACKNIIKIKKHEFIEEDLPQIFKTMKLLNISFSELEKWYQSKRKEII